MRSIGREDDLERLNKTAIKIAREVADDTNTLMAGNVCVTGVYSADHTETHEVTRQMFIVRNICCSSLMFTKIYVCWLSGLNTTLFLFECQYQLLYIDL